MEAVTAGATGAQGTGSKTIADLLPLAVKKYGDKPAQRYKVGEEWVDSSYSELGEVVKEVALGLIDLGIQPGDKVSILAHTRPEWTHACFGILTAGGTLVTIYQTNSPEECQYVLEHSDSRAIFAEDGEQLAKVREVEDRCPELEHVIVMDPGDADLGDALSLDALRERGRGREDSEWEARYQAVTPEDICLYIYTSGTTGPPKGCLLSHANYRAITDAVVDQSPLMEGDSSYLFLPLAHAFAILIQFATFELGAALAYWSRDPKMIIADITQVNPSFFPSVPRMFEKIYTLATSNIEDKEGLAKAVQVGVKVRMMREAGQEVPAELQQGFDQAEEKLFKNVRGLFGTNMRECVTGAAPIAGEILEFFYACGVPVMEGYGMTETSTSATVNRPEGNNFRFGSVGKPQKDVEVKIADDGEVLIKGPEHLQGLLQERGRHEGDARGRLAPHRRPRAPRRGRLPLHHRPQEGHHHHRGRQEHHPGQPRERPEADPLDLPGGGDRRPAALPDRAHHSGSRGSAGARGAAGPRGRVAARARRERAGPRRGPDGGRRGELTRRAGRADQAVQDPRP